MMKKILVSLGSLIVIISLSVFMITASSPLFTILSGIGAVAVILMYGDYIELLGKPKVDKTSERIRFLYFSEHPDSPLRGL